MSVGPGTLLGDRYRIERKLARGGMGEVWVATDTRFNAPVAVKVAFPPGDGRGEFKLRFKREAVIGRLLGSRSTGFVRALDWGEVKGSLFLVMDLVQGARPLDLTQGSRFERLRRLLAAGRLVQEVHALGIVHRDIKPQNFFISLDGNVRLGDFGLAKVADEPEEADAMLMAGATQSGVAMGTPYYMAPEQIDAKNVDQRADVYPLGVMLFQALTQRLPYEGSLPQVLSRQMRVLKGQEPPPRARQHDGTIEPELDALCLEALQPDPTRRLRSAVAFSDRLEAWLARVASTSGLMLSAAEIAAAAEAEARLAMSEGASAGSVAAAPPTPLPGLAPVSGQEGVYRWDRDESLLLWIPPGYFYPGARDDDPNRTLTQVEVPGFYIGRFPVTWRQYARYCKATGKQVPRSRFPAGDDHPVHGVTWAEAQAYCVWAGMRLPDEQEWEYAARGEDPRRYPWGNEEPSPFHMNWAGHPEHRGKRTSPVGSFPRGVSPFGVHDMAGNVQEWLASTEELPGGLKPVRGGAFNLAAKLCQPAEGSVLPADSRDAMVGFRVALSRPDEDPAAAVERARTTRKLKRKDVAAAAGVRGPPPPPPGRPQSGRQPQQPRPAQVPVQPAAPAQPPPAPIQASRTGSSAMRPPPARPAPAPPAQPSRGSASGRQPPPPPAAQPSRGSASGRQPVQRPSPPPPPPPKPVPEPDGPLLFSDEAPQLPDVPQKQQQQQSDVGTVQRSRRTPAQKQLMAHVETLLGCFAEEISRKGTEIKFRSGEQRVSYSFLALDPDARWACLEQRVTFDPRRLQGSPTGRANLLLATNLITHYGRGIRCLVTEDRLRFRRELILEGGPEPLLLAELQANLDKLFAAWAEVFGPLRDVQEGAAWHEALAFLLEPRAPKNPTVLQAIELLLDGYECERQANRLRVAVGQLEEPVDLVWCDDLAISVLVRPWAAQLNETLAVRSGAHAPQIEALLEELNQKNTNRPYALSWDPKRGVVARAHLAGEPPARARILDVFALLEDAVRTESFHSLDG